MTDIIIISSLVAAFILAALIFSILLYYHYVRSSSGTILVKIDYNNKRVMRLNSKNRFLSSIFDAKKANFNPNRYIQYAGFIEFFAPEFVLKLERYFDNDYNIHPEFYSEFESNSKFWHRLSFGDKLFYWYDQRKKMKFTYEITIKHTVNQIFIAEIKWNKYPYEVFFDNYKTKKDKTIYKEFRNNDNLTVIAFSLRPFYFDQKVSALQLVALLEYCGINPRKANFFYDEGMVWFVTKKLSNRNYAKARSKIIYINKSSVSLRYVLCGTIFNYSPVKTQEDNELLLTSIKYSLYHIHNNFSKEENWLKYLDIPVNISYQDDFKDFKNRLETFLSQLNEYSRFNIDLTYIIKYFDEKPSKLKIIKMVNKDNNEWSWNKFFEKVPYLSYIYENASITNLPKILQENNFANEFDIKSSIIKVSQEVYLKQTINLASNAFPVFLIYAYKGLFDYKLLTQKIENDYQKGIATALYIEHIDTRTINLIKNTKIRAAVISHKIASNLNDMSTFYDCANIFKVIKLNEGYLIYENPPAHLDQLVINEAGVHISYTLHNETNQKSK
ncbi:MHO_4530 family protein [Mycoplasma corogypsi]|uniref:MHO_4530 family protein n=1 Tax=Mycoplasma corogypsi TaxID=2106 RepID=UPI0038734284